MKFTPSALGLCLAATGWASQTLAATEASPTFDFKIRGGLTAGDLRKDQADNKAFGFGIAGRLPLGGSRALNLELGFDLFPGRDRDVMPTSGPVYYNYQAPVTTYQGESLFLSTGNSIDFRKAQAQGFSLRASYSDAIPNSSRWYWFAGLSLDYYKATAELSGTLVPMYGAAPGTPVPGYEPVDPADPGGPVRDYYEGWAITREKAKVGLGLLGGVGVPLSEHYRVEFTVRNIATPSFDYRPFTYTGRTAVLEESTHRGFVFELAIALKL